MYLIKPLEWHRAKECRWYAKSPVHHYIISKQSDGSYTTPYPFQKHASLQIAQQICEEYHIKKMRAGLIEVTNA